MRRVVFFPVRHHSPMCARLVVELAERIRPDAVLIEGPTDFNDRIDELLLGHHLPIAIYSYVRLADGIATGGVLPVLRLLARVAGAASRRESSARRCGSSTCRGPRSPATTA